MDSDKLIALIECIEDKLAEDITPQYVTILFPIEFFCSVHKDRNEDFIV